MKKHESKDKHYKIRKEYDKESKVMSDKPQYVCLECKTILEDWEQYLEHNCQTKELNYEKIRTDKR